MRVWIIGLASACAPGSGLPALGDGAHDLDAVWMREDGHLWGPDDANNRLVELAPQGE